MLTLDNILTDRGSKYAVSGGPCGSEAEAKAFIKALTRKKKFAKATHNTWGLITADGPVKNDDGETGAGNVILRMLERGVHIVVVPLVWWQTPGRRSFGHVQTAVRAYLGAAGIGNA